MNDFAEAALYAELCRDPEVALFREHVSLALLQYPALSIALAVALLSPLAPAVGLGGAAFHLVGPSDDTTAAMDLAKAFYGDAAQTVTIEQLADSTATDPLGHGAHLVLVRGFDQASLYCRERAAQALNDRWGLATSQTLTVLSGGLDRWSGVGPAGAVARWSWMSELDLQTATERSAVSIRRHDRYIAMGPAELIELVRVRDGHVGRAWMGCCDEIAHQTSTMLRRDHSGNRAQVLRSRFGAMDEPYTRGLFGPVAAARWAIRLGVLGWNEETAEAIAMAFIPGVGMNHHEMSERMLSRATR